MLVEIAMVHQPLVLDIKVNGTMTVSYFSLNTELVFTILARARYQIPRLSYSIDSLYVSLQDPNDTIRAYRELAEKYNDTFVYRYQDTDINGPWLCSVYGILNDNAFITVPFISFVIE